jgi:shikimate kinase
LEEKITIKILQTNNCVISLGGGAFLNNKIRKEILTNHLSFWLNWDIKTLLLRIRKNKKRPLAINTTDNELITLIKNRSKIYSKAKFKINCNNLTKTEIIKIISKFNDLN